MGDRTASERIARRVMEAVGHRDVAALQACLHPDIAWHNMTSPGPLGSDHEGIGPVMTFLADLFERSGDTLEMDVHDIMASERHVAILVRLKAERRGMTLDDRAVFVLSVDDDLIVEGWAYTSDPEASSAFWA